jgi:hypothetical protein
VANRADIERCRATTNEVIVAPPGAADNRQMA